MTDRPSPSVNLTPSSTGLVAASGGNHGVAVACAAQRLNVPARIFVPTVASPVKIERIRSYGADAVVTGDRYADSLEASERYAAESGAMPIHAYDQAETILGQGSLARELSEQVSVLVAANPVFGLDFAAVAEIHGRILAARDRGAAVLLVSEDLDELLALSDRIVVMFGGRIVHETTAAAANVAVIGPCMAGHA